MRALQHPCASTISRRIFSLALTLTALTPSMLTAQSSAPATAEPSHLIPAITLFGEVRSRSEWDRPGGTLAADVFTYLRSRLGVRVEAAPGARIVLQAQDSRVLGAEGSTSAPALAANVLDLHQGYLEIAAPWSSRSVTLRAGRQEIALGNERLVGAANWTNIGRSFDAVRVLLTPRGAAPGAERWSATTFAAVVDERGRRFGAPAAASTVTASGNATDHLVAGLFVSRRSRSGTTLDGTLLYDGPARYRSYEASDRTTLDARFRLPRIAELPLRVELEGAYQAGRQSYVVPTGSAQTHSGQSVRAWLAGVRIGNAVTTARGPVFTLGADLLSGDATPSDDRYTAFNTLYATNHPFYGLMDVIGDPAATTRERGLADLFVTGAAPVTKTLSLKGEVHQFTLRSGTERPLGWETDLIVPMRLNSATTLDVGYAMFRAGRGAAPIGLGSERASRHWIVLQAGVAF
jgi:hypothetical protein